ncbi:hypothetical protein MTS1_00389 [Microbacterium sp. TS-1]|uniref:DUF4166 domain-containing protein n=1 Tax=Microbacterium sp. TS-1 TaxID=1344956 RepID=UPI00039010AD|nr:DUF4166 domain-containing protein [Microbacterium sp. TS-1]GAD33045.1 hypothetical protein MTS1_00389 [Microbacterium sp. TS-1]
MFSRNVAAPEDPRSIYERALGADLLSLPSVLRAYFGPVPAGSVGRGRGVYDEAGYRGPHWLRPLMSLFARRGVMFPEAGTDVPFAITNTPQRDGTLRGERDFFFAGARRRMVDTMTSPRSGEIIDRLGPRGGLEVRLRAEAGSTGMRLRSVALAVRCGALRLPLPTVAGVTVVETADPADAAVQWVDVRVRACLVGEIFRYRGSFTYRIEPRHGNPVQRVVPPA